MTFNNLLAKGEKNKRFFVPNKRNRVVQAVAVPLAPTSADSAVYRKRLAENYGFRQIGEPLPDNVTLKDIMDTLPRKVRFFPDIFIMHQTCLLFPQNEFGQFSIQVVALSCSINPSHICLLTNLISKLYISL